MRTESEPSSPAGPRPHARRLSLPDWIAIGLAVLLLPALIIPLLNANAAGPQLRADPAEALPGARISISGSGFEPNARGYIAYDHAPRGPAFRANRSGRFVVELAVPKDTAPGHHDVGAVIQAIGTTFHARRGIMAGVAVASVIVIVLAGGSGPSPSGVASSNASSASPGATGTGATQTSSPGTGGTQSSTPGTPNSAATLKPTATLNPGATLNPTATPKPAVTPPGTADRQPTFPIRAAFYYPWFPEAWKQQGLDPFTRYHPSLGFYDSSLSTVIRAHIAAMQYGKIVVGINSWWGQGSRTDARVASLLGATGTSAFRWAVYYEPEGSTDPSVQQISSDLAYLANRYGSNPAYLRVGGRFVVFVYGDPGDVCGMADRWAQANTVHAYIVLKVFSGYKNCANQPESWHQYAPAVADAAQAGFSYSISPGFDKATEAGPRLIRDLARWSTSVRAMVASGAPWQLITTFNEWGEGTSVESATEWQSASGFGAYLDALHVNGG